METKRDKLRATPSCTVGKMYHSRGPFSAGNQGLHRAANRLLDNLGRIAYDDKRLDRNTVRECREGLDLLSNLFLYFWIKSAP